MALKDELLNDPLVRGYPGMTPQEVADDMNTAYRNGPVPVVDVFGYLMREQVLGKIRLVADDTGAVNAHREAAHSLMDALVSGLWSEIDLDDPAVSTMFGGIADALVAAGAITPTHKAAISNMRKNRRTRAQELGFAAPIASDVATDRA